MILSFDFDRRKAEKARPIYVGRAFFRIFKIFLQLPFLFDERRSIDIRKVRSGGERVCEAIRQAECKALYAVTRRYAMYPENP